MVQMILSDTAEPNAAVRLRFYKKGSLSFIAHLDLVRTVTKAIARAGIPVRYSEGFNPHPRLSFATAMSIGLESEYELLDIRLTKTVDVELLRRAFNESLTPELQAVEAYIPTTKLNDIAYSSYRITIHTEGADSAMAERCERALTLKPLVVFKRSKSGDKDTDISGGILRISVIFDGEALVIDTLLAADNAGFLNPEYLVGYLRDHLGVLCGPLDKEYYTLVRTGLYAKNGELFR